MKAPGFVERLSPPALTALGIALVVLISILDYLIGEEANFSIFYLLPITLLT
jgi:hypothetical protein